MMIVDNLLQAREREGRPIRVGMIGAGFTAQGLANTIVELPSGRLADRLRGEQYRHFRGESWLEERLLVAA
jgi:predicted homoserine dehydrogenase-like protein